MAPIRKATTAAEDVESSTRSPTVKHEHEDTAADAEARSGEVQTDEAAQSANRRAGEDTLAAPLIPALQLGNARMKVAHANDQPFVTSITILPESLNFFKPGVDTTFAINCTPTEHPNLPDGYCDRLYGQQDHATLSSAPQECSYYHIGRTNAVGFALELYIAFPVEGKIKLPVQRWFDEFLRPALRSPEVKKYGITWRD